MNNRRRLPRTAPPPQIVAYAAAYRCQDCAADVAPVWVRKLGLWSVEFRHDESCPVLAGQVSGTGAAVAAAQDARLGSSMLYVEVGS